MIDLSGEPSLGTISLTRDGVRKYTYVLPAGMHFPAGSYGALIFSDRAGGVYEGSPIDGDVSSDARSITWLIEPDAANPVPAGANFEVFVYVDGLDFKVRYGRVIRAEAAHPLNPLEAVPPPLMFEDTLQRNQVGPRWVTKTGKLAMHRPPGAPDYAMAARNNLDLFGGGLALFASASALWYAPTQGDTIEMTVGLCDGGNGNTTIVLSSDYAMRNFIGVRFHDASLIDGPDRIQIVTGTAWNNLTFYDTEYEHIVPDDGETYKIRYNSPTNTVTVAIGDGEPILTWPDTLKVVRHGAGFRYTGVIFSSDLTYTGPQLYYWKVKDSV